MILFTKYFSKQSLVKIYYLYIVTAIVCSIMFIYVKCRLNITYFDKFLYKSDSNLFLYFLFHIVSYGMLGIFFGFTDYFTMIIKTIIVEVCINVVKKCSYYKINREQTINAISLSIGSFTLGCLINYSFLS